MHDKLYGLTNDFRTLPFSCKTKHVLSVMLNERISNCTMKQSLRARMITSNACVEESFPVQMRPSFYCTDTLYGDQ